MKITNISALVVLLLSLRSVQAGCGSLNSMIPKGGVVRNKEAAVSIARAMWLSMNPGLRIDSEEAWQSKMVVELDNGVWRIVTPELGADEVGGRWEIDISARDGRFLRAFGTQ